METDSRERTPVVDVRELHKTYPGAQPLHVLKGVSLRVEEGEMVSLMGASGSGKSTLLNVLGILDTYDAGSYYLDGQLITRPGENEAAELRDIRSVLSSSPSTSSPSRPRWRTSPCRFTTRVSAPASG